MYRRPKFLELLLKIREEMALEADYELDQFVQDLRSERRVPDDDGHRLEPDAEIRTAAAGKRKR